MFLMLCKVPSKTKKVCKKTMDRNQESKFELPTLNLATDQVQSNEDGKA